MVDERVMVLFQSERLLLTKREVIMVDGVGMTGLSKPNPNLIERSDGGNARGGGDYALFHVEEPEEIVGFEVLDQWLEMGGDHDHGYLLIVQTLGLDLRRD